VKLIELSRYIFWLSYWRKEEKDKNVYLQDILEGLLKNRKEDSYENSMDYMGVMFWNMG
jgi:hypothetical protein